MLSGVIQPLARTRPVDRSAIAYPVWEESPQPNPVTMPWTAVSDYDFNHVRQLVGSARTAVIASSRAPLYEHVIAGLKPGARAYAYGAQSVESNRILAGLLAKACDTVSVRLGPDLPADWIVVDSGRAGLLLVGAPGEERRWVIPVDQALARSLFEAFRVLFWHHARREGSADGSKQYAFRPPLPSPYPDPGPDVALPAGRLCIDRPLPDAVSDAEFRVVPNGTDPGRAAVVLVPPISGAFEAFGQVAARGAKVVWTDLGLPRTAISRQRLVMDLIAGPVGIQLEWGVGTAVDAFHRVSKACESPSCTFHPGRRLRDMAGPVLLEGATMPAPTVAMQQLPVGDLRSPLLTFEAAEPEHLPEPSPLARQVTYSWRIVPEVVPAGAARAQIVRQWTALDEWTSRSVDVLRQRLSSMEGEEKGFMDRLRGFLRGQDAVQRERQRIRSALDEVGEQAPSQRANAADTVRTLQEEAGKIKGILQESHTSRQRAEDDAEEATQRQAWKARIDRAGVELASKRAEVADLETQEAEADAAVRSAEAALSTRTAQLSAARVAELTEARDRDEAALAEARSRLKDLDTQHRGNAPKEDRKPLTTRISELEPAVAAAKRNLAGMDKWSAPPSETLSETQRIQQARELRNARSRARAALTPTVEKLAREAAEAFAFRPPTRLPAAGIPDIAVAPPVPTEALPELGELFEHQGQRFLAVRTWEQVTRASQIAARLRAELVAFPDSIR